MRLKGCIALSARTLPYKHEPKHPKYISEKHYSNVMRLFFKKIVYYMIKDGEPFLFPHRLGKIQILRYNYDEMVKHCLDNGKKIRQKIDYNATKKLRERGIEKDVKFNCKTTGGYWWKIHWFKNKYASFKTQKIYSFRFNRPNIRPNTYNKNNPELSVIPYFRDKGWEIYSEFDYKNRDNDKD